MESPNSPKNAVADRELTSEFVSKWDQDLETIDALTHFAEEKGGLFIRRGGLAAEAHAGGHLTRAHNDIDAQFINSGNLSGEDIFAALDGILQKEKTAWVLYKQTPDKIEFRESEDDRPFFNRRRLELHILAEPQTGYEKSYLFFNDGRSVPVNVAEFYDFVAQKVRKLFLVNDRPEEAERETNLSDYSDLKRLLEREGYDKNKVIDRMAKILKKAPDKPSEAKREYDYVSSLLTQL